MRKPIGLLGMEMPLDALNDLSDDALLVLYANGDSTAARLLNLRLTPATLSLARHLLHDLSEAEDVAQEAMLRLWKIAPNWRAGEAKPSTWLYRVVSNLCFDRLRRRPNIGLTQIAEPADGQPSVEQKLQVAQRADALRAALNTLPERQKQAVVLRHIEGQANPEIAEIMQISVEAVESLVARGKRTLKAQLSHQKQQLGLDQ